MSIIYLNLNTKGYVSPITYGPNASWSYVLSPDAPGDNLSDVKKLPLSEVLGYMFNNSYLDSELAHFIKVRGDNYLCDRMRYNLMNLDPKLIVTSMTGFNYSYYMNIAAFIAKRHIHHINDLYYELKNDTKFASVTDQKIGFMEFLKKAQLDKRSNQSPLSQITDSTFDGDTLVSDTELCDSKSKQQKDEEMTKLYKIVKDEDGKAIKKPTEFGEFLATDGEFLILKIVSDSMTSDKPTVRSFTPNQVEEVKPWVFKAKAVIGGSTHYFEAPKDSVFVGELIVSKKGTLYAVTGIDIDAGSSSKFEGKRLVTEEIKPAVSS